MIRSCGFVVCIDEDWLAIDGREAVGPEIGSVQVVTSVHFLPDGSVWLELAGWSDMWEAVAFRAITASEYDLLVSSVAFTGSGASEWSESGLEFQS